MKACTRLRANASCAWPCSILAALVLAACSGAFDWRQMEPPGLQLALSMPCRPASHARRVKLAAVEVEMTMFACTAQDLTFAVGTLDTGDPARVGDALVALRSAALANVQGQVTYEANAAVTGMTPHPAARDVSFVGRLPNGKPVHERVVVFSHGARAYQAVLVGPERDEDAARTFIGALRVLP